MALRQCQHILRISPFLLVDNDVTFIGTSLTHPITLRHLCQFRLKTIQMKTTITHVTKYHVVLSPSILANPANSGRTQGFFSIVARCLHRDHEIEIFDAGSAAGSNGPNGDGSKTCQTKKVPIN